MSASVALLINDSHGAAELAADLAQIGHDARQVASTEELHQALQSQATEFVVIENELASFFTGLDILEKIHSDLLRPVTILIASPTADLTKRARSIGVDRVVPPDSARHEILKLITQLHAEIEESDLGVNRSARQFVERCSRLGPMPEILVRLAPNLTGSETVTVEELAAAISVDPKLTAELLCQVNSAGKGLHRKVTSVPHAVTMLGVRQTVAIMLALHVAELGSDSRVVSDRARLWAHRRTVLISKTAHNFARHLTSVSAETAYVIGLFQDIGIMVLASGLGSRYERMIRRVQEIGALRLEIVEQNELGLTHADVGAALLETWAMPPSLIAPVLEHHQADADRGKSKAERSFLHCMRIAEAFANLTDGHGPQRFPLLLKELSVFGKFKARKCLDALRASVGEAVEATEMFRTRIEGRAELERVINDVAAHYVQEWGVSPGELRAPAGAK